MNNEYLECSCGAELLQLQYNEEDDNVYISFFELGQNNRNSLKWKISQIFNIFKSGTPYSDFIILDKNTRNKLKEFLEKIDNEEDIENIDDVFSNLKKDNIFDPRD
jgi:hypothetical protein